MGQIISKRLLAQLVVGAVRRRHAHIQDFCRGRCVPLKLIIKYYQKITNLNSDQRNTDAIVQGAAAIVGQMDREQVKLI